MDELCSVTEFSAGVQCHGVGVESEIEKVVNSEGNQCFKVDNGRCPVGVNMEPSSCVTTEAIRLGDQLGRNCTGNATDDCVNLETDDDTVEREGGYVEADLFGRINESMGGTFEDGYSSGQQNESIREVVKPFVGMEFSTGVEFVSHMHKYGYSCGFGVKILSSCKMEKYKNVVEDDSLRNYAQWFDLRTRYKYARKIRMGCRKHGIFTSTCKNPDVSTTTCKSNCKYVVNACRSPTKGDMWRITKIEEVHNHDLCPSLSRFLPRVRTIPDEDQLIIMELHKGGVRIANMFDIFVNRYKGYDKIPFTEYDLSNFVAFMHKKPMKDTDFAGMELHFKKMKEISPDFWYEFDVDENLKLKSVFWADSRCRAAFNEFGDVVSFDTTFVTNRYKMPFAPFIGVNHHGKTMLFGCALITNEDADSFSWVFNAWKRCMGKEPTRILTDQDRAIARGIAREFPGSSHRWCIWHVMRNCRKHLGMRCDWSAISGQLRAVLHDSFSVEEFETGWHTWVQENALGDSNWVADMYTERARWVPIYFKTKFWAGMSSTQRSEGVNHYLKGFVNVNTCLTEFVEQYGKGVSKRVAQEGKDTVLSYDLRSNLTTRHYFEPVFERMYTREKFLEFHEELREMSNNIATVLRDDGSTVEYVVLVKTFRVGWSRLKNFGVVLDRRTMELKCDCLNFEFKGILCAHALRVFWMEETAAVPERYILKRWRKDIPRKYLIEAYPMAALLTPVSIEAERYDQIHRVAQDICLMVMNNELLQKETLENLRSLKAKIKEKIDEPDGISSSVVGSVGTVYRYTGKMKEGTTREDRVECTVKDPVDKRGRGRGQTKRKLCFSDLIGKGRGCSGASLSNAGSSLGGGKRAGKTPTTTTPTKDVEVYKFHHKCDESYVPCMSMNRLRHGFLMDRGTGKQL